MKNKQYILIIFLVLNNIFNINAQNISNESIKVETAWQLMEVNNLTLKSLLIDQEATLRDIKSKGYLIPGISLTSSISRSSQLISNFTNPQSTPESDNWSLKGGINLNLNINTSLDLENQIKNLQYNIILLEKEIHIRDIRSNLLKLYYQISAGEQTILLQQRILGLSESRFEQVEELYNKGLRSEYEVLTAKISVARDQPSLKKAIIDQEKRLITFKELLGLDPNKEIKLDYPVSNNSDISFDIDLDSFNPIDNIEYQITILKQQLSIKNRELFLKDQRTPTLGINLGWSTSINPMFDPDSWSSEEWEDSLGLGFSFSLPLDPKIKGSKGQLALSKLDDSIIKSNIALEESKREHYDEIKTLLLDLELSISNIIMNELNIKLQEENFNKLQSNFETGRSSLQDLDSSRQELQKALVTLENERLNKNIILIELEKIFNFTDI